MKVKDLFSPWMIAIAIIIVLSLFGGLFLLLDGIPISSSESAREGAALTVIPAPLTTPTPAIVAEEPTLAPSSAHVVEKGAYVQIRGTGGDGLRLRDMPSLSANIKYLGMDDETFIIIDGPSLQDGFTWWHLESPSDQIRNGWAVSDYLQAINDQ